MRSNWKNIFEAGLTDEMEWTEVSKVRLLNKLCIATFAIVLLMILVRYFTNLTDVVTSLISGFTVICIYLLNTKGKHLLARHITCFGFPITIGYIMVNESGALGEMIIFLLCIILSYILYEDKKYHKIASTVWIIALAICSFTYVKHFSEENLLYANTIGSIVLFISCVFTAHFLMVFYQAEIHKQKALKNELFISLQEKNVELERFNFIASHDLKEPLRNIIGFTGLIKQDIQKGNTKRLDEFLTIIEGNARQMNGLIVDSLELISYTNSDENYDAVDLNNIVNRAQNLLDVSIKNKNVKVIQKEELPIVQALENEMLSCFKNLMENAIKYNENKAPIIELDYKLENGEHIISVADNGKGIKEDYHEKIFEMFGRYVKKSQYQGSGLGLAICKKIINKMGGRIWVKSEVGRGSTFYVALQK